MTQNAPNACAEDLLPELAALIVSAVNLDVRPQDIDPDAPLYREGLGLDSIDILEIALVLAKNYGVSIKAGDSGNAAIFGSLRTLAAFIHQHRATQ